MKKILYFIAVQVLLLLAVYIFISFCVWNTAWFISLGSYDAFLRSMIGFLYICGALLLFNESNNFYNKKFK